MQGSALCFNLGYHPQTDGQTEVLNRYLETYLKCFCSLQPKKWVMWLSWAEWSYNTSFHSAIKMTPFEAVYGFASLVIATYEPGTTKVESVERCLKERTRILTLLKCNLEAAQCLMKVQADKKRTERAFEVGNWVYLRLGPYQHKSLAAYSFHKLQPRFYGPFLVLAKVGNVAYKIKLPNHSKLHPVFHVSCLKKHLGGTIQASTPLPVLTDDGTLQDVPIASLDCRIVKKNNLAIMEVLIQWQNHSREDAT